MRRALVIVVVGLATGCGAGLFRADLQPAARRNGPPIGVVVSAAGATQDLLWSAEAEGDERSAIVLRVHVQNQTTAARTIDPAQFRLSVTGAGGKAVARACTAAGRGEMPSSVKAAQLPPFSLQPAQTADLWLLFEGFAGLPLASSARIELLVPGEAPRAAVPLVLAAPAAPGPRWVLWQRGGAFSLRAGAVANGTSDASVLGFETTASLGRLVLGLHNTFEDLRVRREVDLAATDRRYYNGIGIGLFAGVDLTEFLGLTGGVHGIAVTPEDDDESPENREAYLLRLHAALRFTLGHSGALGGGAVAVQHRRRVRLRSYNVDVGYAHSLATRFIPSGGSVLVMLSAPVAAF
jgi:hypothetical protein